MTFRLWLIKKLIKSNETVTLIEEIQSQQLVNTELQSRCDKHKSDYDAVMHDHEQLADFLNRHVRNAERNRREPISAYVRSAIMYLEQQHDKEFDLFLNLYSTDEEDKQRMMAYWNTIVADRPTTRSKVD